jgi:putative tryptophan/tyrosine transport system substrate-binding protein
MRRSAFIALLGIALLIGPSLRGQPAQAESSATHVIGFLNDLSSDRWIEAMTSFRKTLSNTGFVEGQNVTFIHRWSEGRRERLPALAAELARAKVSVIVASGHTAAAMAARAATSDIPIVFITSDDPVRYGLVSSLERPGGNATGMYVVKPTDDYGIRQKLLQHFVPNARSFFNLNIMDASSHAWERDPETAIANLFDSVRTFDAKTQLSIPTVRSLKISSGPFLDSKRRDQLVSLVARRRIAAIYDWRDFTESGGLMSYGASLANLYAQMGGYVARILRGASPADMPVLKPTKFETIVNLKTAADLGFIVPPALVDRTDEIIQ